MKNDTSIDDGYTIEFWADEGHLRQPGFFPVFWDAKKSADEQQTEADGKTNFTNARFVVVHDGIVIYLSKIIRKEGETSPEYEIIWVDGPENLDTTNYRPPQGVGGTNYQTAYERDRAWGIPE